MIVNNKIKLFTILMLFFIASSLKAATATTSEQLKKDIADNEALLASKKKDLTEARNKRKDLKPKLKKIITEDEWAKRKYKKFDWWNETGCPELWKKKGYSSKENCNERIEDLFDNLIPELIELDETIDNLDKEIPALKKDIADLKTQLENLGAAAGKKATR